MGKCSILPSGLLRRSAVMATRVLPARGGDQGKPASATGLPNQTLVLNTASQFKVGTMADPNCSLYCTNLPDKLRKHDLRLSLYMLFSTYGTVLDVVAMKTQKMRGQAHIVFKDVQASTQAMRALQGFEFFGKQMVCFCIVQCGCSSLIDSGI